MDTVTFHKFNKELTPAESPLQDRAPKDGGPTRTRKKELTIFSDSSMGEGVFITSPSSRWLHGMTGRRRFPLTPDEA